MGKGQKKNCTRKESDGRTKQDMERQEYFSDNQSKLVKAVTTYACETWTMRKTERK